MLTIVLDTPIDSGSINTKNVTLSPSIEGTLSVSPEGKKVSYMLSHSLSIGESYELRIASTVKKSDGTTLGKDAFVTFLATPAAQAVKIFPSGTLDTLSQNITVVFNTPMVPLTNLEERDRLPCPLKLSPMVEGKCVWTNSSILEYIPKNPLQGATHYRLQVANAP